MIEGITYNGSVYVAVGWEDNLQGVVYSSADLSNWTKIEAPHTSINSRVYSVIWDEEKGEFMTVGSSRIMGKSKNGVDWEFNQINGTIGTLNGVALGNGKYVAVAWPGNIFFSSDGENWSGDITTVGPSLGASYFNEVRWTGEHFVAVGRQTTGHAISMDGETWVSAKYADGWNNGLFDAVFLGDHFLAVGDSHTRTSGIYLSGPGPNGNIPGDDDNDKVNEDEQSDNSEVDKYTDGLILQVGPNSGNHFIVELTDARTKALGLHMLSLLDRNDANSAIKKVDIAIQRISNERTKFGVYENALQHIANNVTNYELNLTVTESLIRDADIAKEMMEFTKNNILSQAAQAMLAQSNQMPQGVLQLLR